MTCCVLLPQHSILHELFAWKNSRRSINSGAHCSSTVQDAIIPIAIFIKVAFIQVTFSAFDVYKESLKKFLSKNGIIHLRWGVITTCHVIDDVFCPLWHHSCSGNWELCAGNVIIGLWFPRHTSTVLWYPWAICHVDIEQDAKIGKYMIYRFCSLKGAKKRNHFQITQKSVGIYLFKPQNCWFGLRISQWAF